MTGCIKTIFSILLTGIFFLRLTAQDTSRLKTAISLSQQAKYHQAETILKSLINEQPSNVDVLIAIGYNNAWNKHFKQAEQEFTKALSIQPLSEGAGIGLGYTLSWNHEYERADTLFKSILKRSADNQEALKGKAYNNLWRGKYPEAEADFNTLIRVYGAKSEYSKGLAAVFIDKGNTAKARELFQTDKELYIQKDKVLVAANIQSAPGYFELTPVIGYSKVADENEFGLRSMEVAINPRPAQRYWLRYDNSLSQDVLSIINNEIPAYALFAGTTIRSKAWLNKGYTTIEAGYRKLNNDNLSQLSFRAEEVYVLPSSFFFKLGAMYAPRNDKTSETLIYGGIGIPVATRLNIQPTYFLTLGNVNKSTDSRFMLQGNYKWLRGTEFTSGVIVGKSKLEQKLTGINTSQTVFSIFALINIPVAKRHWIQPLIRYEKIESTDLLNVAVGYRFRIER